MFQFFKLKNKLSAAVKSDCSFPYSKHHVA